jgi:GGDEF domain-containing protein
MRTKITPLASIWQRGRSILLLGAFLLTTWASAIAQTPAFQLDAPDQQVGTFPAPLDVATGLAAALSIEDIAAGPRNQFVPFDPKLTYPIATDKPLWLRLRVSAKTSGASNWQLDIPSVVVDRFEIYQKSNNDEWVSSIAGDKVAHDKWPIKSLRPRFPLLNAGIASELGERDVYIRVMHSLPTRIAPHIIDAKTANERDLRQMLWMGALVGLFSVLLLICLQMSIAYKDLTYFWYANYLLFTMLTGIAYSGLGQHWLWPLATQFSSNALVYFVLAAFAFNLQFVSAMFGEQWGKRHRWITRALMSACGAYMIHVLFVDEYAQTILILMLILVSSCVFIVGSAILAWLKNVPYSGYWVLIYAPYLLSIALSAVVAAGQLNLPWLPSNLPLLTTMIEALAMMFCLNASSRNKHTQSIREQASAQRDPLTGFLNEFRFMELAHRAWLRASKSGRDITMVYALVESKEKNLSTVQAEAMMLRSVRMVRIAVRESDGLGRIGRNMLGICMPDMKPSEDLSARLSRLVALGLMLDPQDSNAQALKFTLSVGTWRINTEDFKTVDKQLRALLLKDSEDRPRTIRFLEQA